MPRPTLMTVGKLAWRIPLAAIFALAFALLLAGVLLALGSMAADTSGGGDPGLTALRAMVPVLGLATATIIGLLWGVSSVAVLVRDAPRERLGAAMARSFLRLPRQLATLLLLGLALALSLFAWPLLSLYVVGRAGWRARRAGQRRDGLRGLWLALPFSASVVVLAMIPSSLTKVLSGHKVLASLRKPLRDCWAQRAKVLAGLVVLGLTSWGLGVAGSQLAIRRMTDAAPTMQDFVLGVASSGLATLLLVIVAGTLLGLLARGSAPLTPPGGWISAARRGGSRVMVWRPARASGVALSVSAALMLSLLSVSTFAPPAQAAGPADIMVNTLDDSATPGAGECADIEQPCGVRAALAEAATRADAGVATSVGFGVSGTVTLAGTLDIRTGVTLDGLTESVTLDGGGTHQVFVTSIAGGSEGGSATLRRLTVTGGQSDTAGAGLFSNSARVVLEQMVFSNNISGQAGGAQVNGGAVAVPFTTVVVTDSTFTNNQALTGVGGAVSATTVQWTNSTSFNDKGPSTEPYGGAINASSSGTVLHGTVIGGGGVAGSDGSPLVVQNSIIDTPNGSGAFPCARTDPASAGNLDPTGSCFGLTGRATPFGTLGDNGGPTPTIALQPGSPAIGTADSAYCTPADQRGQPRPTPCDIGAFQFGSGDTPVVNVALTAPATAGLAAAVTLNVALTSSASIPAGKVRFLDGTTVINTLVTPDVNHQASTTTSALPQGLRTLTAEFVPDDGTSPTNTSADVQIRIQASTTVTLSSPPPTLVHDPATITATVVPEAASDAALQAGGTMHFTSGTTSADVTVTNGVAVWNVASLPHGRVEAAFSGDDAFAGSALSQNVTSADIATTTIGALSSTTPEYRATFTLTAGVRDSEMVVPGAVELFVDGVSASSHRTLVNGDFTFTLDLSPGTHALLVRFHPEDGWASSDSQPMTVNVVPAASSVTLSAPSTMTYGGTLLASADLTGASGSATVHLLDGSTSIASDTCTMPCTANFSVGGLLPGDHVLVAEITGSSTTATSRSSSATLVVAKATPSVTLDGQTVRAVAELTELDVSTNLAGDYGTFTLTDETGQVLDAVTATAAGLGHLEFTSAIAGVRGLTVTYVPTDTALYTSKSIAVSVTVPKGTTASPTATWSANPMPGSTTATVQFSQPVTGSVFIIDTTHGLIGSGTAANGLATVDFYGPAGECYCFGRLSIRYDGDVNWLPVNGAIADLNYPAHPTVTTMAAMPSTVNRNEAFRLGAIVTSATAQANPTGSVVFTIDGVDQAPMAVTAGSNNVGRMYTPAYAGTLTISARFEPGNNTLAASASASAQVTVSRYDMPVLTITGPSSMTVSGTLQVQVQGGTGANLVAAGSTMYLKDGNGVTVGSGTWSPQAWPPSTVSFVPAHAGPLDLTLHFPYGSDGEWGTSAPIHVDVAPLPSYLTVTSATVAPQMSWPLEIRVSVATYGRVRDRSFPIVLTQNGQPAGAPTTLSPGQAYVTFWVVPAKTGLGTFTATTVGDGLDFGAGDGTTYLQIAGVAPQARVVGGSVLLGTKWAPAITVSGQSAAPLGRVVVTLLSSSGQRAAGCDYVLPAAPCEVDTSGLSEGAYKVSVDYDGDSFYAPATGEAAVTLYLYSSRVESTFAPLINEWVVGNTVHATWTTSVSDPGGAGSGRVQVEKDGNVLCDAPAVDKGCSFKVPASSLPISDQPERMPIVTRFIPGGFSAPSTALTVGPPAPRCVGVSIDWSSKQLVAGEIGRKLHSSHTCSVAGVSGYEEGSDITLAFTPPASYRVTDWLVDGVSVGRENDSAGTAYGYFKVVGTTSMRLTAVLSYEPVCVEIRLVTEAKATGSYQYPDQPIYQAGTLRSLTAPNCKDPSTSTADEAADLANGIGRYAVGTVIDLEPRGWRRGSPTLENPDYRLVDIPGATAPTLNQNYYRYTVTGDADVYARFRLGAAMCTPANLYAGIGGKLEVVESQRAERNTHILDDFQGRCITATGSRGYLAGTELHLRATPTNDGTPYPPAEKGQYFIAKWLDDVSLATPEARAAALTPSFAAKQPITDMFIGGKMTITHSDYTPARHDVTVPMSPVFRYGVQFGHISCVSVDFSLVYPWNRQLPFDRSTLSHTPSNCPAKGGENWKSNAYEGDGSSGQEVEQTNARVWYVAGTEVSAWSDATRTSLKGERQLVWSVTDNSVQVGQPGVPTTATTTVADESRLRFDGRYILKDCTVPNVVIRPVGNTFSTYDATCGPGTVTRGKVTLGANEPENLKAVWSMWEPELGRFVPAADNPFLRRYSSNTVGQVSDTFVYHEDTDVRYNRRVNLDYCASVPVGVSVVDAAGAPLGDNVRLPTGGYTASGSTLSGLGGNGGTYLSNRPNPTDIFIDGDTCPAPLMVRPGTSAQIGLSGAGAQNYRVVKWTVDGTAVTGNPMVSVDSAGNVLNRVNATITPRCQTLTVDSIVLVKTAPNCPGSSGDQKKFMPGTPVELNFNGHAGQSVDRWTGVDASEGDTAIIILNRDRNPVVHYTTLNDADIALRLVTAMEQRVLSALVTAATGVAMGFLFVAQGVALVAVGIGMGLGALGVSGSVVNGLTNFGLTIQAGLDVVESLSDCTQQWATGSEDGLDFDVPDLEIAGDDTGQAAQGQAMATDVAMDLLEEQLSESAQENLGMASDVYDAMNLMYTNMGAYFRDPADSWAAIADIGGCMQDAGMAAGAAGTALRNS